MFAHGAAMRRGDHGRKVLREFYLERHASFVKSDDIPHQHLELAVGRACVLARHEEVRVGERGGAPRGERTARRQPSPYARVCHRLFAQVQKQPHARLGVIHSIAC